MTYNCDADAAMMVGCVTKSHTISQTIIHVMGRLPLVGSLKLQVSFAKEPYKRDYILQKLPII